MLAHTKKHHTEKIALRLIGPAENRQKALASLKALGFVALEEDRFIAVSELFPEVTGRKNRELFLQGPVGKKA